MQVPTGTQDNPPGLEEAALYNSSKLSLETRAVVFKALCPCLSFPCLAGLRYLVSLLLPAQKGAEVSEWQRPSRHCQAAAFSMFSYSGVLYRQPRWAVTYLSKSAFLFYILPCIKTIGCAWMHRNIEERRNTLCCEYWSLQIIEERSIRLCWLQRWSLTAKLMYVMFFSPFTMLIYC